MAPFFPISEPLLYVAPSTVKLFLKVIPGELQFEIYPNGAYGDPDCRFLRPLRTGMVEGFDPDDGQRRANRLADGRLDLQSGLLPSAGARHTAFFALQLVSSTVMVGFVPAV